MSIVGEFLAFLKERKKLWLVPLVLVIFAIGGLLLFAGSGSVLSPFIYTLF